MGFGAAPVCSETFTMAEDPKASAVGEKHHSTPLLRPIPWFRGVLPCCVGGISRCHAPLFSVLAAAAATLPSWKPLDLANAARALAAARVWPPAVQRAVAQRSVARDLVPPWRMADGRYRWMVDVKPEERWDHVQFSIFFFDPEGRMAVLYFLYCLPSGEPDPPPVCWVAPLAGLRFLVGFIMSGRMGMDLMDGQKPKIKLDVHNRQGTKVTMCKHGEGGQRRIDVFWRI